MEIVNSVRNLLTSEVINQAFNQERLVFPADAGECFNFNFDSYTLTLGDIVVLSPSLQKLPITLAVNQIDFDCDINGRNDAVRRISSVDSDAVFTLDFFSEDFERVVANNVKVDASSCPEEIFTLNPSNEDDRTFLEFILEIACPDLLAQVENTFLGLIENDGIEPLQQRATQFGSIDEAISVGESNIQVEQGYELLIGQDVKAEAALRNTLTQVFATPALEDFFAALRAEDASQAAIELSLILAATGAETQSDSDNLDTTQLDNDLQPFGVQGSDLLPVLEFLPEQTVEGGLEAITVGEVVLIVGEDSQLGRFLLLFGRDTPFIDVVEILIPVAIALLQAGEDEPLLPIIEPVFEFADEVPKAFVALLNLAFNDVSIGADEPLPQDTVDLLRAFGLLDPEFGRQLDAAGDEVTLREVMQILNLDVILFETGVVGTIELEILRVETSLFFEQVPAVPISDIKSVILPQFDLIPGSNILLEYEFRLIQDNTVVLSDTVRSTFDVTFSTQEAFAPVADFVALGQEFGLDEVVEQEELPSALTNFSNCILEAVGFIFTAQVTNAKSIQQTSFLVDPTLELNAVVSVIDEVYKPAGEIAIENFFFKLQSDNENQVLAFANPEQSCRALLSEAASEGGVNAAAIAIPIVLLLVVLGVLIGHAYRRKTLLEAKDNVASAANKQPLQKQGTVERMI